MSITPHRTRRSIPLLLLLVSVAFVMSACGATESAATSVLAEEGVTAAQSDNASAAAPTVPPPTAVSAAQPAPTTAAQPGPAPAGETAVHKGMTAGFTPEGFPYLGNPGAAVTLYEYTDYLCPFCSRHVLQTMPTLYESYIEPGKILYVFRDMPLASLHPTSPQGHAAATCVAEQGAALFWQMHDILFGQQSSWSGIQDPTDFLAGVVEEVGADPAAYQECLASGRAQAAVQQGIAEGQALGFSGTPSFRFVNNETGEGYNLVGAYPVEKFSAWLDAILAGEAPPQDEQEEAKPPELPYWANSEGLKPDPERPGFNLAGDPYKGNPEAMLVVVEYSSFQCPSCREHALAAQPTLDETFVDTGEVMWVYKHLPLKSEPQSPVAAAAAECAGDQGKFWEMYHALFAAQSDWAVTDANPELIALANELDLDVEAFTACLMGRQAMERVLDDVLDAQGVADSTPTFVALFAGRGGILRGARPVDQFVTTLEGMLEQAGVAE